MLRDCGFGVSAVCGCWWFAIYCASLFFSFVPCPKNLGVRTVNQQQLVPVNQLQKNSKILGDNSNLKMRTGKMMTNMLPENSREKYD